MSDLAPCGLAHPRHALCSKCGKGYWWDGGRGHKLKDYPSPCCDAKGHAFNWGHTPNMERRKQILKEIFAEIARDYGYVK